MRTAGKVMQFIETVEKRGINKEVAREIVELVDSREGDLATKQDIEQLRQANAKDIEHLEQVTRQGMGHLREANAKDIEKVEARIEAVRDGIKTNRWIFGLALLSLLPLMIYLHSDTRNEQKQMRAEIDKLEARVGSLEAKVDNLEANMNKRFTRLEQLILSLHGEETAETPLRRTR